MNFWNGILLFCDFWNLFWVEFCIYIFEILEINADMWLINFRFFEQNMYNKKLTLNQLLGFLWSRSNIDIWSRLRSRSLESKKMNALNVFFNSKKSKFVIWAHLVELVLNSIKKNMKFNYVPESHQNVCHSMHFFKYKFLGVFVYVYHL